MKFIKKDKDALIIIQSDHGFGQTFNIRDRSKPINLSDEEIEKVIGIFSSFKIPNSCKKFLNDNFSAVNTFRIIFACLDKKEPELLPYKTFFYHNYLYELQKNKSNKYEAINF